MTDIAPAAVSDLLTITADIVAAHVSNNHVAIQDLSGLILGIHGALANLGSTAAPAAIEQVPAVSIRASIKPDHLVCLEDGKKFKTLKRHLMSRYGMTPADYRAKWKLPADYPMVAPEYARSRSVLAKQIGLGRKAAAPAPAAEAAPLKKARGPRRKLSVATPST